MQQFMPTYRDEQRFLAYLGGAKSREEADKIIEAHEKARPGFLDSVVEFGKNFGRQAAQVGQGFVNSIVDFPNDVAAMGAQARDFYDKTFMGGGDTYNADPGEFLTSPVPLRDRMIEGTPRFDETFMGRMAGEPKNAAESAAYFLGSIGAPDPSDIARVGPLAALTVWHGTPHKWAAEEGFPLGRPRNSAIRSGEGAAAYGHGVLYGAEEKKVAQDYRKMDPSKIGPPIRTYKGQEVYPGTPEYHAASLVEGMGRTVAGVKKEVKRWIKEAKPGEDTEHYKNVLTALEGASGKKDFGRLRSDSLYKLDIPDAEVEKFLDWDKPLSEQPKSVRDAIIPKLREMWIPTGIDYDGTGIGYTGREIYRELSRHYGQLWENPSKYPDQDASAFLKELGIPGIKYLDQGSRPSGKGTRNFVVFDEGFFGPQGPGKVLARE